MTLLISSDYIFLLSIISLISFISLLWYLSSSLTWRGSLPPGPTTVPILGNLLDLPRENSRLQKFSQWKEKFGDIVYLSVPSSCIAIINSMAAVLEILDNQSPITSNRPISIMAGELMGATQTMAMAQYDDTWKDLRKLARHCLAPRAVRKYQGAQEAAAIAYAHSLLGGSEQFLPQLRFAIGKLILTAMYGLNVDTADNKYIVMVEEALDILSRATVPGTYLVDSVHLLKHLPSWFPCASFLEEACQGREHIERTVSEPFEYARQEFNLGTAPPSFTSELLAAQDVLANNPMKAHLIKWAAGTMYGAGTETTYATLAAFFLAMALHPEAQRMAQSELDRVLGGSRLPTLDDQAQLPYVNALVKEVMRWHVVVPLCIAHCASATVPYREFLIPKGTILIPNVWSISRDPKNYMDPGKFIPERFLDSEKNILNPEDYVFGFGRRTCPGAAFGLNTIYIFVACILFTFNISNEVDESGNEVRIQPKFTSGLVSLPEPFRCTISPRSPAIEQLVKTMGDDN